MMRMRGSMAWMRCVLCALLVLRTRYHVVSGIYLLLVGSSVDRYIVQDWCYYQGRTAELWGNDSIADLNAQFQHPATQCIDGADSMASLHIFGSGATGNLCAFSPH